MFPKFNKTSCSTQTTIFRMKKATVSMKCWRKHPHSLCPWQYINTFLLCSLPLTTYKSHCVEGPSLIGWVLDLDSPGFTLSSTIREFCHLFPPHIIRMKICLCTRKHFNWRQDNKY
jgi:hypothetical protein